jgi:hypothetical protein
MASKKTTTKDPLLDEEEFLTAAELDIDDFLEEWAPHTVVVEIYQHMKDGSRPQQERVGIDILKADLYGYLREQYPGGGKFELQFKDTHRRIRKKLTIVVGPGPKSGQPVNGNGAKPDSDFTKELLLALIASNKPAPFDLNGLGAILAALRPAENKESPAATLGAMAAIWQNLKPKEMDSLAQFKEMVSLTKDLMPDRQQPIEENMYTVVKHLGQQAIDTFSGRVNGGGPPRGLPPGAQLPPPQLSITGTRTATGGQVDVTPRPLEAKPAQAQQNFQDWIRAQLSYLKQKAIAGKGVDFWIDYTFENQEEPGCAAILAAMENGVTFDQLLQFDPEIAQNPALQVWFKTFYDAMRAELDANLDTTRGSGNASDAGSHAPVGAPGLPDDGSPKSSGTAGTPRDTGSVVA